MSGQTILEAGRAERTYWRDLWRYRELFQVLAWRDVSVRYKQTAIGVVWAVLRPLLTMIIFTVVFSRIARLPTEGSAPYALMVMAGILPWTFFATALSDASNSLISNSGLIGKVYFPRLVIPSAAIVVSFVDLMINFLILAGAMVWFRFAPGWQVLALPAFVALAFLTALGPALWVTALNVKYRDFRYIVAFAIQFGVYVSPVGFSSQVVPAQWRLLYSLNPMVGVIEGFRWSLLGGQSQIYWPGFALGLGVTAVFLWLGVRQFRRMERTFADLI